MVISIDASVANYIIKNKLDFCISPNLCYAHIAACLPGNVAILWLAGLQRIFFLSRGIFIEDNIK